MRPRNFLLCAVIACPFACSAQISNEMGLSLPQHNGRLSWSAAGFDTVQSSAKPDGKEIGVRARDDSGRLEYLSFIFLFPQQAPMTSARCSDGVLGPEKSANKSMTVSAESDLDNGGSIPLHIVEYSTLKDSGGREYVVRGFVAAGDICGDFEFYADNPIHATDQKIDRVFESLRFDKDYVPQFTDLFLYAQILYDGQQFAAAGPAFEAALPKLDDATNVDKKVMKRVLTDQAGMAYGISGNLAKSRAIFNDGIASDPDYPLYYYNLACADAEEKNLAGAQKHLQQAFDRRANLIKDERFPDPTQDDSFIPYRDNKAFWAFLVDLRTKLNRN